MKTSFFKKIKLLLFYRSVINKNYFDLSNQFKIKKDWVYRLYTVINVPTDEIPEQYNLKKSDIDALSQMYITEYTRQLSAYLNKIGLSELYEIYSMKKVGKYNYLLIVGFSLLRTTRLTRTIIYTILVILISFGIYLILK